MKFLVDLTVYECQAGGADGAAILTRFIWIRDSLEGRDPDPWIFRQDVVPNSVRLKDEKPLLEQSWKGQLFLFGGCQDGST